MDVTPELLEIALGARRDAMARTYYRKSEFSGAAHVWYIIEMPDTLHPWQRSGEAIDEVCTVHRFNTERECRGAYESIIMRAILDAVANHLVKGQALSPSQAA